MDIRLISMDLDGTALRNDHKTFSPRLQAALEEAHRRGIIIAPVTGRQFALLPPPLQAHPVWENLAVLCNGAQVRRLQDGEVLFRTDITEKALRDLLDLAERLDIPIEFSVDGRLHLTSHSLEMQKPYPQLVFHRETILAAHGVVVESLEPVCAMAVEKVNLPYIPEALHRSVTAALWEIEVSAVWASPTSMEITHPDATKGKGVEALCRLLDVPMASVMALGDSGNDETMLRQAGLGIAMGNAPDFIKACAHVVTETNEQDGAAIAIERYALAR